jgi:hypothetical protein
VIKEVLNHEGHVSFVIGWIFDGLALTKELGVGN